MLILHIYFFPSTSIASLTPALALPLNKKIVGIISIGDVLKIMIKEQKELIDHLQKFITS